MIKANNRKSANTNNKYIIPFRISWFVFKNLLIIVGITLLSLYVFLTAMHAANIYILVSEGITLRSACILGDAEYNDMYEYFSDEFMKKDTAVANSVYKFYNIINYDYRLEINRIDLWAWDTTATMTVTERIPIINGTANADAPSAAIPKWTSAKYTITCIKIDDRWYINEIILITSDPPESDMATPNMSLLPAPTGS